MIGELRSIIAGFCLLPNFGIHKSYYINPSAKIFVTGGTGFLGAYIIKALSEKGYRVRAIRRQNKLPDFLPATVFDTVEWVAGDVLDTSVLEDAMHGMDAVIHSAAKVSFSAKDHREMMLTNIEGTANVVNAALATNTHRMVHISSVAALGRTSNGETVTEKKQWEDNHINTRYALSKYHAEMEVWRGAGEGLTLLFLIQVRYWVMATGTVRAAQFLKTFTTNFHGTAMELMALYR